MLQVVKRDAGSEIEMTMDQLWMLSSEVGPSPAERGEGTLENASYLQLI
jgi:hypothetical protein